ncbi:MAG: hypothetical protein LBM75_11765, partial [Myxococcales bacterium]|nr:hypothetical protein [Myxococcales bacterium]
HVSLVMLAFAMLAAIRRRINEWPEAKTNESRKELHGPKQRPRVHSVVNPRNPTNHSTPCPTPNRTCIHYRLILLATRSPGRRERDHSKSR